MNQADMRGITPLGVAVGFNRIAIVEALLEAGAAVEKPDGRGNTVLHYAAGGVSRQLWGAMNVGRSQRKHSASLCSRAPKHNVEAAWPQHAARGISQHASVSY